MRKLGKSWGARKGGGGGCACAPRRLRLLQHPLLRSPRFRPGRHCHAPQGRTLGKPRASFSRPGPGGELLGGLMRRGWRGWTWQGCRTKSRGVQEGSGGGHTCALRRLHPSRDPSSSSVVKFSSATRHRQRLLRHRHALQGRTPGKFHRTARTKFRGVQEGGWG